MVFFAKSTASSADHEYVALKFMKWQHRDYYEREVTVRQSLLDQGLGDVVVAMCDAIEVATEACEQLPHTDATTATYPFCVVTQQACRTTSHHLPHIPRAQRRAQS